MYFLYSSDNFLLTKSCQKLIKQINHDQTFETFSFSLHEDSLEDINNELITYSLFGTKKIIIINDAWFVTENKEKAIKDLNLELLKTILNNTSNNVIIFLLNNDKLSERLTITKIIKEKCRVETIPALTDEMLTKYILVSLEKEQKHISKDNLNYLKTILPYEMQIVQNEINKLKQLTTKEISKEVINDNVINYFDFNIFDISKMFLEDDIDSFIKSYKNYLEINETSISLIPLLAENVVTIRNVSLLKNNHYSQAQIAQKLNLHPYRTKIAYNYNYSVKTMNSKIEALYKIMKSIVNSKMDNKIIPEYELLKVMKGTQ